MQIANIEKLAKNVIKITLTGDQIHFITDGNKGATIILNTDIKLNRIATSRQANITMKTTNEKAVTVQNEGISASPINIVAPTGIITLNSVTNTINGQTAVSMESNQEEVKLERKTQKQVATYTNTIINNSNTSVSNVKIIGTIPTKGDKFRFNNKFKICFCNIIFRRCKYKRIL